MPTRSTAAQTTTTAGPIVWQARRNRQPRRGGFGARPTVVATSSSPSAIPTVPATAISTDVESGTGIPTVEATTVIDQTAVVDRNIVVAHRHDVATTEVRPPPTFTLHACCSFCLCCWPLGLVALFYSWKTSKRNKEQNFQAAVKTSITAFWLSRLAVIMGILMFIITSLVVSQVGSESEGGLVMAQIFSWTTAFISLIVNISS